MTGVDIATADLGRLEGVIDHGLQTFVEVGAALKAIRDRRLYRESHGTFEDYCRDRWEWSRRYAYNLIESSGAVDDVRNCAQTPTNEAQARELAKVPEAQRVEVWEVVVEDAPTVDGKPRITARQVAEAASAVLEVEAGVEAEDDPPPSAYPWGDGDKWCWKLRNLYSQAPKRSQAAFRKWMADQ